MKRKRLDRKSLCDNKLRINRKGLSKINKNIKNIIKLMKKESRNIKKDMQRIERIHQWKLAKGVRPRPTSP